MNHWIFQIFLGSLLLITVISGRALHYDQLDEDVNTRLSSSEAEEIQDLDSDLGQMMDDSNDDYRTTSRASHTITPHTRQAIIDILQKALDQGWRPNLKHYIPATRFGRHRR